MPNRNDTQGFRELDRVQRSAVRWKASRVAANDLWYVLAIFAMAIAAVTPKVVYETTLLNAQAAGSGKTVWMLVTHAWLLAIFLGWNVWGQNIVLRRHISSVLSSENLDDLVREFAARSRVYYWAMIALALLCGLCCATLLAIGLSAGNARVARLSLVPAAVAGVLAVGAFYTRRATTPNKG